MNMIARAADGGIAQPHRAIMDAAQRVVLRTDLDIDQLEEIEPAHLAEHYKDALCRGQARHCPPARKRHDRDESGRWHTNTAPNGIDRTLRGGLRCR